MTSAASAGLSGIASRSTYLVDSLPAKPYEQSADPSATAPADPDHVARWDAWINAYGAVTSVTCGPHGDSGFGLEEARRQAESRRSG